MYTKMKKVLVRNSKVRAGIWSHEHKCQQFGDGIFSCNHLMVTCIVIYRNISCFNYSEKSYESSVHNSPSIDPTTKERF